MLRILYVGKRSSFNCRVNTNYYEKTKEAELKYIDQSEPNPRLERQFQPV